MKNYKDPHKAREEKKYDNPIPSRELMLEVMDKAGHPIGFTELTETLGITEEEQLKAIKFRLRAMERDGQILFNRGKKYVPVEKADLIAGKVQGHPDGFGFLIPDDGSDDLYLHGKQMRKVFHGDRVLANVTGTDRKGRREGAIVEIIEHNTETVVGRYFVESGLGFVTPDNSRIAQDILVPPENNNGAKSGQIVVAQIVEFPTSRHQPIGKIAEVLGDHMAPGMEIEIALRSHDLPHVWPREVAAATDKLSDEVLEEDKKGRTDLRKMPLVTIDGEDSRDFDDAVYCEKNKDGNWVLTVAIADVSHYIQIGSALDKEAFNRATSVYFPAEVIPMLPEKISNGLCSLNPEVDRLCMVCEATIDGDGDVISYNFTSGLMNSHARLTYTKMAAIVVDHDAEGSKELREEYKDIVDHLDDLYKLYAVLRKARDDRGSIDFETTETQIVFGKDRKIENIKPTTRNDAHRIIEECMVTANMCAARFLKKHKIPALHRVHNGPETEKLTKVHEFLGGLGLKLGGGDEPQPSDYAFLLASVKDRPDARLIQTVMLRSMSRAAYEPVDKDKPESTRHFGLARKDYAHFTSPIRRYPDLLVHRAILHILKNGSAENYEYDHTQMKALGAHSSECEKRADDASRDVMAWLKAEYMQDKVGETFTGIISTVTSFGLFVELDDVYVEGLVHITALKSDYYHFEQAKHKMVGENSGKTYRLGDTIEVLVARVDLDDRKIDFTLPGSESDPSSRPKKGSASKKSKKAKNGGFKSPKKKDKTVKKGKRTTPKKEKKAKNKAKRNKE